MRLILSKLPVLNISLVLAVTVGLFVMATKFKIKNLNRINGKELTLLTIAARPKRRLLKFQLIRHRLVWFLFHREEGGLKSGKVIFWWHYTDHGIGASQRVTRLSDMIWIETGTFYPKSRLIL